MNEVDKPKKPMIYYYAIVLLITMLVNLFMIPAINRAEVKEVDYGTFMTMTEKSPLWLTAVPAVWVWNPPLWI